MKRTITTAIAAGSIAGLGLAVPAMADNHTTTKGAEVSAEASADMKPVVVEKNARGMATKVRIGANTYDVCMTKDQDSCIQPRAAGLNWGNRALNYWPGKPASEM